MCVQHVVCPKWRTTLTLPTQEKKLRALATRKLSKNLHPSFHLLSLDENLTDLRSVYIEQLV